MLRPDGKEALLRELALAGEMRAWGRELARGGSAWARLLAPRARDAGATVQEIADALGMSRPGVYVLMETDGSPQPKEEQR